MTRIRHSSVGRPATTRRAPTTSSSPPATMATAVRSTSTVTVPITVLIVNHPPVVTPISDITLTAGQPFDQFVQATDPDGNPLVLSVTNGIAGYPLPSGVALVDNGNGTGVLQFTPPAGNRAVYTLTLTATDNGDGLGPAGVLSGSYTFQVTVQSATQVPTLGYLGDQVAVVGQPFTLDLQAAEADQDSLTFAMDGLPAAATLTPSTYYGAAALTWTPTAADIGAYNVTFTVTDTGNSTTQPSSISQTIRLVVRTTDTPPIFPATAPTATIAEGQAVSLSLTATKAEGDPLTYTAQDLPTGANLDPATGLFTWTPQPGQAGNYAFTVTAGDGSLSSSETVDVTVTHTNFAPIFVPLLPQYAREGTAVQFTVVAANLDGDPIIYTLANPPAGSTLNATERTLHLDARLWCGGRLHARVHGRRPGRPDRHDERGARRGPRRPPAGTRHTQPPGDAGPAVELLCPGHRPRRRHDAELLGRQPPRGRRAQPKHRPVPLDARSLADRRLRRHLAGLRRPGHQHAEHPYRCIRPATDPQRHDRLDAQLPSHPRAAGHRQRHRRQRGPHYRSHAPGQRPAAGLKCQRPGHHHRRHARRDPPPGHRDRRGWSCRHGPELPQGPRSGGHGRPGGLFRSRGAQCRPLQSYRHPRHGRQ